MRWLETKVVLEGAKSALAQDLIADRFHALGLPGVVLDGPENPADLDWAGDHPPPPAQWSVTGYLPMDGRLEKRRRSLENAIARISEQTGVGARFSFQERVEEDWAESWKEFFWPQRVGRQVVVKPTWRDYAPVPGDVVVEIDPGMAFGTGTHPTTALCIRMIERHVPPGCRFLDLGCGSGILMITAAKLGASRILGVDRDELAVRVAASNLRLNNISTADAMVVAGDLLGPAAGRFDVIAVNILTDVILALLEHIPAFLAPGGVLICSGIITAYANKVDDRLNAVGLAVAAVETEDEWVAFAARAPGNPVTQEKAGG